MIRTISGIALLLIVSGCSTFEITHEHGNLPKLEINLPEDCGELRIKSSSRKIMIIWKKRIDI